MSRDSHLLLELVEHAAQIMRCLGRLPRLVHWSSFQRCLAIAEERRPLREGMGVLHESSLIDCLDDIAEPNFGQSLIHERQRR